MALKGTGRLRERLGRASAGRLLNRGSEADPGRRIGVSGIPRFSADMSFDASGFGTSAASGFGVVATVEAGCGDLVLFLAEMAGFWKRKTQLMIMLFMLMIFC